MMTTTKKKNSFCNWKFETRHKRIRHRRVLWAVVLHKHIPSFYSNQFDIQHRIIHV